jgi:hypothetical protein
MDDSQFGYKQKIIKNNIDPFGPLVVQLGWNISMEST